ncbi:Protein ENHANCED DISEASE RESISTANCE 2, C-terminal [Dillenia turbinata]|uniref:Protein ENHANCED DISEASE RESISTANCE 2, C-terminal n=1 Tax=Dillenia turbinata TaxID=194707 RepID=A0AAN8V2G0_9MAGN
MGACVSTPKTCVGGRRRRSKKKMTSTTANATTTTRNRRKGIRRRVPSLLSDRSLDRSSIVPDRSFNNPTSQAGSVEEAWYDSVARFDSDLEEDFESVQDEVSSPHGSISSTSFTKDTSHTHDENNVNNHSARNSASEVNRSSNAQGSHSVELDSHSQADGHSQAVFLDEISTVGDDNAGRDGILDNCGILPNNCLPCLASTVPTVDKRRSTSPPPPNTRKKPTLKLSFKWREVHASATPLASKMVLQRPIAGSQVPFCPADKNMLDSWSAVEPGSFKVRGENYFREKKKELAPNHAAYYPFGVDTFLSARKINHIARFVELPLINFSGKLPPILVVNAQIPLYPATIFQSETDGEGINIVLYFKLSESYSKELPQHFQENIKLDSVYIRCLCFMLEQRLIEDEMEKVKGFPVDTVAPFRERLKILGRVGNIDDLHLSAAERKLMHAYNEKPVLSRPQHEFYIVSWCS